MKIEQARQGSVEVITIVDTITDEEAEELRAVVESAICDNAGRVVLNVARTPYVDSQGLEALLACAESSRRAGQRIKLAAVTDTLREILDITELSGQFEFHADCEQAVRSYLHGSTHEVSPASGGSPGEPEFPSVGTAETEAVAASTGAT